MSERSPHILVSLIGDVFREPAAQVKYGHFIRALEHEYQVSVCDGSMRGLARIWNGLSVFHPDLKQWKERFYQNLAAFRSRSWKVSRFLKAHKGNYDLILQIGVLFDSTYFQSDVPLVIYTDYTSQLSRTRAGQGRSPLSIADFKKWFAYEQIVFHKAVHIFTRGSHVRESILQDYDIPADRVTAVGGGVNFEKLPVLKSKEGRDRPAVLFIGKDFCRKGGDRAVAAFQQVRKRVPEARLILVTSLPAIFTGDLSGIQIVEPTWDRGKIRSLYEEADCFILPSRLESWGDVLLEAMAYGLPCIGVNDEAMADIIVHEETGLLAVPGDVNSLTNALEVVLTNPAAQEKYGRAGRRRVEAHFTWENVIERMKPKITEVFEVFCG
ncbi:MAG: glycosyltransferase family 4 protein [Anaerolineales bacterium]|nr:glycosyltransferase family 4 protein [Anaerolineales bacterium]